MTKTAKTPGVAAVDRALAILSAFGDDGSLTLAELARRTGLYKSTVLRLCASLERAGFLRRLPGGYHLGPALFRLGGLYQRSFRLEAYVTPVLDKLAETTGESASLYVREGEVRVCLFREHSPQHRVLHYVTPGTQLPLATGASGQVLVAFTEEAQHASQLRRELLATSLSSRKAETAALACPVFAHTGFVGALSLAGPRARFGAAARTEMSRQLLLAAAELSERLGGEAQGLKERAKRV